MAGGCIRQSGLATIFVLALAGSLAAPAVADSAPSAALANFTLKGLFPGYDPEVHDYVVRCQDKAVNVHAHAVAPWRIAVAGHPPSRRNLGVGDVAGERGDRAPLP